MTPADLLDVNERELQVMILFELHGIHALLKMAIVPLASDADAPQCDHPVAARIDHSVMGKPKWYDFDCTACDKHIVDGKVA